MGFLDSLSTVLDRVGGAAQGFFLSGGNPAGAVQGLAAVEERKRQEKILERNMAYVDPFSSGYGTTNNLAPIAQQSSPGFFAPGGAFRTGVRDFGGFLREFSPIAGVFGLGNRFQNIPPAGAQTINFTPPAETSTSGEIAGANLGAAGALVQAARGLARSPAAQGFLGGAAGTALMDIGGGPTGMPRITRRMKSDVRKIYMMAGMDPVATAQILNNLGTYPRMQFDANLVFFILTKRFRNDGPVVTKAAVRKTKQTLRRMKGVVDMYNSVCKPAPRRTTTRKTPQKAVQLIKN
jgi:hypothetical protein